MNSTKNAAYPTATNLQNLTAENIHLYIGVDTPKVLIQTVILAIYQKALCLSTFRVKRPQNTLIPCGEQTNINR